VHLTSWRVLPLQKAHERQTFTCGSPTLDRYLQNQARQDSEKRVAAVFALVHPPASQVLGYYTLSVGIPVDRDRSFRFVVTGDSGSS